MAIEVVKKRILYSSVTCSPLIPSLFLSEGYFDDYIKKHPFPATKRYTLEELRYDMVEFEGQLLTFADYVTDKQIEWIEEYCNSY